MAKEPDMQHIDDFVAELDPSEMTYLMEACSKAMKSEESDEEEPKEKMPMKASKKPVVPDTADEISLEDDEEETY
jgi:hypothetical protein